MARAAETENRSVTINIRAPRQQRDLIDRAAESIGKTRTEFMLDAARRAAEDTLLDRRVFFADAATFDRVMAILDAPAQADSRLVNLMKRGSPWEM